MDLHIGHAGRRRRLHAVSARARSRECRDRLLGQPIRLSRPGAALCPARIARAEQLRPYRCRRRCGAAGAEGELRALGRARETITAALAREGLDYPLLVQGEGSRSELLSRFRVLGNAVLLGSQSFWEGVDVQGEALSLVVIDKLPFAPPDDPLFAARLDHIARAGGNPFLDYQLPQAAISLKQGAGRLIRSESDRGVLMICDRRLADKPYGRRILQALPPMRRTRELDDALAFFGQSPLGK